MSSGTVVETAQSQGRGPFRPIMKFTLAWTCTSGGAVSYLTSAYPTGEILRVVFIPGAGGAQPSNGYSATLTDKQGMDLLAGRGAGLSNVNTTHICPGVKVTDGTTAELTGIITDRDGS
ncbi:MAG TPA: hypothetical protein VK395_29795 [Gemmataceae bacterium]|nr:hypothetical protein [Gemmataceae bacterium]